MTSPGSNQLPGPPQTLPQALRHHSREIVNLADALHRFHVYVRERDVKKDSELQRRTYAVAQRLHEAATEARKVAGEIEVWMTQNGIETDPAPPAQPPVLRAAPTTAGEAVSAFVRLVGIVVVLGVLIIGGAWLLATYG